KPIRLPKKHERDVTVMAADAAGKILVTADNYGGVFKWDVERQTADRIFADTAGAKPSTLAVSADGKWVAISAPANPPAMAAETIHLWSGSSEKSVWEAPPKQTVRTLAFSPDGGRLAVVLQSAESAGGNAALPLRQLRTSDWQDATPPSAVPAREVAYPP